MPERHCAAHRENHVDSLPNLARRIEPTKRIFTAFVVQKNNRFLVQQRPAKVVNAGLWEFPNVELANGKTSLEIQPFQIIPRTLPLCTIRHSITRYRITLNVFRAALKSRKEMSQGKWLSISEMKKLAFSSAHRQILEKLEE